MTPPTSIAARITSASRRRPRRGTTDGDLLGALGSAEQSARDLADDLAELVHAGLLVPVDDGDLRFAVNERDDRDRA